MATKSKLVRLETEAQAKARSAVAVARFAAAAANAANAAAANAAAAIAAAANAAAPMIASRVDSKHLDRLHRRFDSSLARSLPTMRKGKGASMVTTAGNGKGAYRPGPKHSSTRHLHPVYNVDTNMAHYAELMDSVEESPIPKNKNKSKRHPSCKASATDMAHSQDVSKTGRTNMQKHARRRNKAFARKQARESIADNYQADTTSA